MRLGDTTITLIRRTTATADEYGNDTHTTLDIPLAGCRVYPRMSAEGSVDARNQVISGVWVLAPATEKIRPGDAVRIGDDLHEVDGEASSWASINSGIGFQQVALRRVTG